MLRLIARRAVELAVTLLVILTLSFFVVRLAPGSPFASEKGVPPEVRAALERRYRFDQPIHVQYVAYMKNLLQGDLGLSTKYPRFTINEIIALGLPVTAGVALVALAWALLLGVPAGLLGALRQNTAWDHGAMALALAGLSVPSFVLGPLLALGLSLTLYWLPPGGWGSWRHALLPGLTLGTVYAAYLARLTRAGMLEVIRQDFVRTAHAKGLPARTVLVRHALRGGLGPVVTFLGPMVAHLLTGSVVVETIFAVPGMGPFFVTAAFNRDYFLVMGTIVVYATLLLVLNLVVDVAYGWLDPRVRHG